MLPFPESILKAQAAPGDRAGMHALGEGRKLEALHDYLYKGIVKKRRKLALSASSALQCNLSFFPYPSPSLFLYFFLSRERGWGVTGKKD